ncbi:MAG: ATPase [Spirochaetes bacterium]|uniref:ATPase n=1 Tax=Candidatus Ornithospirochaeta stercoripullorum TaxID=2840899 RepID=A0A9D9H4F5_9SPIO|nr:ATPase [Candidatus Ornithospirochaeta stercoripullorum]
MSMFTRKMKMLTAVVMESDRDSVVKALLEKGVMEFVHIGSLPDEKMAKLSAHSSSVPKAALTDMRIRVETLLKEGGISLPELDSDIIDSLPVLDMDSYRRTLDKLSLSLQSVRDKQRSINQESNALSEIIRYSAEKKDEYLDLRVGENTHGSKEDLLDRLEQVGGVFLFSEKPFISLTLRRDSQRVTEVMDKFGWTESTDSDAQKSALGTAISEAKAMTESYKTDLEKLSVDVRERIRNVASELLTIWKTVRLHELCEHVESFFSYTRNTTLFSGWVPAEYAEDITALIGKVTSGRCIIEWTEADEVPREEVPVEMSSPKILKPFERMVNNYSTPEYGSINPTPFTAIAYLCMFALMFADLGQGFILLLVGLIGSSMYKKHPEKKDGIISRYLCSLLLFLGPASMIGGLLFGSCFGFEIIPPLWFPYDAVVEGEPVQGLIQDIYDILGITIKFGIVVIYLGLILNWINLVRKKRFFELVFDKNGIVGGVMYALGIWFAWGFVASGYKTFPSAPFFAPVLIICLVMIIIKGPLDAIIKARNGEKESVGQIIISTVMDFLVEVLEIFSGLLSNTLSFMRVAGLGIAHASLMSAFYQMAAMPGNIIAEVLIMILGNVLVIVLEGLSAGIQSLRLNYYEFFTKYFTGHGVAFEPVGLRSRAKAD